MSGVRAESGPEPADQAAAWACRHEGARLRACPAVRPLVRPLRGATGKWRLHPHPPLAETSPAGNPPASGEYPRGGRRHGSIL